MRAEAYKKGDIVAVVHMRENGQVYGHTQREDERFIEWTYFFKRSEVEFAEDVAGAEEYDVRQLPALQCSPSRSTGKTTGGG